MTNWKPLCNLVISSSFIHDFGRKCHFIWQNILLITNYIISCVCVCIINLWTHKRIISQLCNTALTSFVWCPRELLKQLLSWIAVNVNLPQKYLYQHSDWTKMHWHKRIIIYSVMTLLQIKISNHSGQLWYDISQGRYRIMHLVTVPILPIYKTFFRFRDTSVGGPQCLALL